MKALDRASTQTKGLRMTERCKSEVEPWSWLCPGDSSPVSTSIGGNPLDSGVSWSQQRMTITPMAPAAADPKKPACHPAKVTIDPTKRNEKNSPRLWLAEQNP